jgi:hypothetical protein
LISKYEFSAESPSVPSMWSRTASTESPSQMHVATVMSVLGQNCRLRTPGGAFSMIFSPRDSMASASLMRC